MDSLYQMKETIKVERLELEDKMKAIKFDKPFILNLDLQEIQKVKCTNDLSSQGKYNISTQPVKQVATQDKIIDITTPDNIENQALMMWTELALWTKESKQDSFTSSVANLSEKTSSAIRNKLNIIKTIVEIYPIYSRFLSLTQQANQFINDMLELIKSNSLRELGTSSFDLFSKNHEAANALYNNASKLNETIKTEFNPLIKQLYLSLVELKKSLSKIFVEFENENALHNKSYNEVSEVVKHAHLVINAKIDEADFMCTSILKSPYLGIVDTIGNQLNDPNKIMAKIKEIHAKQKLQLFPVAGNNATVQNQNNINQTSLVRVQSL